MYFHLKWRDFIANITIALLKPETPDRLAFSLVLFTIKPLRRSCGAEIGHINQGVIMTKHLLSSTILLLGLASFAHNSNADEVRVGVMIHDVDIPEITHRRIKERSTSVTAEYIFDAPKWLDWTGARPYIYGSANLGGNTHHGGVGLNWRGHFTEKFYAEFGGGLSVHSGTNKVDFPSAATLQPLTINERLALFEDVFFRDDNEIQFGSTVLFRAQLALGYDINDTWSADVVYEHLSNGRVFSSTRNDGLDSVGFRLSRKF